MDTALRLNDYNIYRNPAAGSHDPSMMWDPMTERYYSYCTDIYEPAMGLSDQIGIPVRSSADLVHFRFEGTVLSSAAIAEGRDNGAFPPTKSFWAPYVEYVRGEYRMYYSATRAFGSSESRIWLAVAKHPLGPFENRGVAVDTWGTDDTFPNAIDPHIVWDKGVCWLVYGSFFGGIYIKEMDSETGLPADKDAHAFGICISRKRRGAALDGPEGASVAYVPETGWYYLFQSYGWLGDGYDIRVARSKCVTGPYRDWHGNTMVEDAPGLKLAGSYRFTAQKPPAGNLDAGWRWGGFRGPGHGVPFFDPVQRAWFFVHHVRDGAEVNCMYDKRERRKSYRRHYLMIRPMFFQDGWPVLGPEPYTGERTETISAAGLLPAGQKGCWELVRMEDRDNEPRLSVLCELDADSDYLKLGKLYRCRDFENQCQTVAVTGIDDSGVAYWGKLRYSVV